MRLAFQIEYLGKEFRGSQAQKNARTVQSVLEDALNTWFRIDQSDQSKKRKRLLLSGRTDSGVHASGQVAHFDLMDTAFHDSNEELDLQILTWGLNGILPDDISVIKTVVVPETFHARFSAVEREYTYRLLNRNQRSPLLQHTHYFVRTPLDIKKMQEAIICLAGSHDFAAFKSSNSDQGSTICRVRKAKLLNLGEGELEFSIAANHFVYNMIRIIVGTLVEIGLQKRPPESLKMALIGGKRELAGPTAPSKGLCLVSVKYPEPYTNIFD